MASFVVHKLPRALRIQYGLVENEVLQDVNRLVATCAVLAVWAQFVTILFDISRFPRGAVKAILIDNKP